MALELVRHNTDNPGHWVTEEVTGYPPIPDVLPVLRRHVLGRAYREPEPTIFWPHDVAWDAVLDLHKNGEHDVATELAQLLMWCDMNGHGSAWEIREASTGTP